jgi:hypothetical protein
MLMKISRGWFRGPGRWILCVTQSRVVRAAWQNQFGTAFSAACHPRPVSGYLISSQHNDTGSRPLQLDLSQRRSADQNGQQDLLRIRQETASLAPTPRVICSTWQQHSRLGQAAVSADYSGCGLKEYSSRGCFCAPATLFHFYIVPGLEDIRHCWPCVPHVC